MFVRAVTASLFAVFAFAAPHFAEARVADEVPAPVPAGPDGFRPLSVAAARDAAARARLPVVLVATAEWSAPSRRLETGALADGGVRRLLAERAVAVKVAVPRAPTDEVAALLATHRIEELPAIVVLDAGTRELGRIVGVRSGEELSRELGAMLEAARPSRSMAASWDAREMARPIRRYELGAALLAEGAPEEALEHLLAAYDAPNTSEPGTGVLRNGPVLVALVTLSRSHAPAREALAARHAAARARVEAGSATNDQVEDYAALARTIGAPGELLALYDALVARGAPTRTMVFDQVLPELVALGRDAEVLAAVPDPLGRVERRIEEQKRAALHPVAGAENVQWRARRRVLDDGFLWYGPLLRSGRRVEANALADRLVAFDPSDATYAHLVRIAMANGKHVAARDLVTRGRSLLPADRRPELEAAAALVPELPR